MLFAIEELIQGPYLRAMIKRYENLRTRHDKLVARRAELLGYIPWLSDIRAHGEACRAYLSDVNNTSERLKMMALLERNPHSGTDSIINIPMPPHHETMDLSDDSFKMPDSLAVASGRSRTRSNVNYAPASIPVELLSSTWYDLMQIPGVRDRIAQYRRTLSGAGPAATEEVNADGATAESDAEEMGIRLDRSIESVCNMILAGRNALQAPSTSDNRTASDEA